MLEKLNIALAEEIAKREIGRIKDKEDREFILWHSKAVANIAGIIAKDKAVDRNILIIAGLLHDIGRSEVDKGHAKMGIEILEKEYELDGKLRDCILNHGSKENPKTEEGRIIQLADKLFQLNSEFVKMLFESNKGKIKESDIVWLNKIYSNSIGLLEKFEF